MLVETELIVPVGEAGEADALPGADGTRIGRVEQIVIAEETAPRRWGATEIAAPAATAMILFSIVVVVALPVMAMPVPMGASMVLLKMVAWLLLPASEIAAVVVS